MIPTDLTVYINKETNAGCLGWDGKSDARAKSRATTSVWDQKQSKWVTNSIDTDKIGNDPLDEVEVVRLFSDKKGAYAEVRIPGKSWTTNVPVESLFEITRERGMEPGNKLKGKFVWVIQKNPILMDIESDKYKAILAVLGQKGFRDCFPMTALVPGVVYLDNVGSHYGYLYLGEIVSLDHSYRKGKNRFSVTPQKAFINIFLGTDVSKRHEKILEFLAKGAMSLTLVSGSKALRSIECDLTGDINVNDILLGLKKKAFEDGMKNSLEHEIDYTVRVPINPQQMPMNQWPSWGQNWQYGTKIVGNAWFEKWYHAVAISTHLPVKLPMEAKAGFDEMEAKYSKIGEWGPNITNNVSFTQGLVL